MPLFHTPPLRKTDSAPSEINIRHQRLTLCPQKRSRSLISHPGPGTSYQPWFPLRTSAISPQALRRVEELPLLTARFSAGHLGYLQRAKCLSTLTYVAPQKHIKDPRVPSFSLGYISQRAPSTGPRFPQPAPCVPPPRTGESPQPGQKTSVPPSALLPTATPVLLRA